ncbi:MAG: hypothetical protein WBH57_11880 [Anaerolineae bacterium]
MARKRRQTQKQRRQRIIFWVVGLVVAISMVAGTILSAVPRRPVPPTPTPIVVTPTPSLSPSPTP